MKTLTVATFNSYIEKADKDNLFVIYGEEQFFHDIILKKLESRIFSDHAEKSLNFQIFYGSENTLSEIITSCLAYPMLSNIKMIVVKEFDKLKIDDGESFLKYINKPQSSTVLVLISAQWAKTKFYKEILAKAVSTNCKSLSGNELYMWVKSRFAESGIIADDNSVSFLIENIGHNLLRLNLEIEKIINFIGSGHSLSVELISRLTGFTRDVNIFNLQKALSTKNLNLSIKTGMYLLEQGESLAAIIPMLFLFFRKINVVKELKAKQMSKNQILSTLGGHPFAYTDIFTAVDNFDYNQLNCIFEELQNAEVLYKTSQQSDQSILTKLYYTICTNKSVII